MKKLILMSLFASSLLFANEETNTTISKMVQDVIPGTAISKIEKGEINGLYKAFMPNGDLLYIEPNQKLIFFGQIWTSTGMSLTQNDVGRWQQELANAQIENITPDKLKEFAIQTKYNKGSERYEVVLFTDPECPYCKKVEEYLKTKKVTVFYNYMPLDIHPKAKDISLKLINNKKAKDILANMEALAKELNITGTPKLFIIDKKDNKIVQAINGANIPQIEQYLK